MVRKATELAKYGTIPAIAEQKELIEQIVGNDYLEFVGIADYEDVRIKLRDLIKFIPEDDRARYDTISALMTFFPMEWNEFPA